MEFLSKDELNNLKKYTPNRYVAIGFLLGCLLLAGLYLLFTPAQYRISSKMIAKSDLENNSLMDDRKILKSAGLIQEIITGLNLQPGYLEKRTFTEHRLNDLSSPVQLVLDSGQYLLKEVRLDVILLNDQYFTIKQNDAEKLYQFGQTIRLNNTSFRIFKNRYYSGKLSKIIIDISDINSITQQYADNLVVAPLTGTVKGLIFSVLETDPERGSKFLTRLMELYADKNNSQVTGYNPTVEVAGKIATLSRKITSLQEKAGDYKNQSYNNLKNLSHEDIQQQIAILNAFEPYVKSSLTQFVQLPDTYDLKDADIKNMVDKFNRFELDRQKVMGADDTNDKSKENFDSEITNLKKKLLTGIDFKRRILTNALHPNADLSAVRKEILYLDKIRNEQKAVLRYYQEKRERGSKGPGSAATIIKPYYSNSPETPNPLIVWLSAIILGLMAPFILKHIKVSYGS